MNKLILSTAFMITSIVLLLISISDAKAGQTICTKYKNETSCQVYDDSGNYWGMTNTNNATGSGWAQPYQQDNDPN